MKTWLSPRLCLGLLGSLVLCGLVTARAEQAAENSPSSSKRPASQLGGALAGALQQNKFLAFPGTVAPGAKGMVQQSEWQFPKLRKHIQLAFVLDATKSMKEDIDSLKASLATVIDHLRRQVSEARSPQDVKIQIAIVVYRDWWLEFDFKKQELLERRDSPVEVLTKGGGNSFSRFRSKRIDPIRSVKRDSIGSGSPRR